MPPRDERVEKPEQPESSRGDSTVALKQQRAYFCISDILSKSSLGWHCYETVTQAEAAKILGVKQPEISRLKKGKFNHYSVERLLTFLNRFNRDIEIRITPSEDRVGQQRVITV